MSSSHRSTQTASPAACTQVASTSQPQSWLVDLHGQSLINYSWSVLAQFSRLLLQCLFLFWSPDPCLIFSWIVFLYYFCPPPTVPTPTSPSDTIGLQQLDPELAFLVNIPSESIFLADMPLAPKWASFHLLAPGWTSLVNTQSAGPALSAKPAQLQQMTTSTYTQDARFPNLHLSTSHTNMWALVLQHNSPLVLQPFQTCSFQLVQPPFCPVEGSHSSLPPSGAASVPATLPPSWVSPPSKPPECSGFLAFQSLCIWGFLDTGSQTTGSSASRLAPCSSACPVAALPVSDVLWLICCFLFVDFSLDIISCFPCLMFAAMLFDVGL